MRILGRFLTVFLLSSLFTAPSTADIIDVKIRSDKRHIIIFSEFKYSNSGHLSVAVSSVGISSIPVTSQSIQPDPSRIGLFLLSDESADQYRFEFKRNPGLCALDNKFIIDLFNFQNISSPSQSSFNKSYNVTYPGLYSLYFVNCNDLSLVTMDVHAEFYNTNDNGTTKDYLAQWQPQPSLYFRFFLIYLCFLVFWITLCFKNRHCFQMIHLLMGVLLVLTLPYFIFAEADQQDLKLTGTHHRWLILFYIFQCMRNVLLFTVIVLIGAGWCFSKRFLPRWEIFILTVVILLQVWVNLSSISSMVGESGPYKDRFTIINAICCIVVFFHTLCSAIADKKATGTTTYVWSFGSLKDTIDKARRELFAFVVLFYLLMTGWYYVILIIPTEFIVAQEISSLVLSLVMFYMYRPFVLDDKEENCKGSLDLTSVWVIHCKLST